MARRRNYPWGKIKEEYLAFCELGGICDEFGIPYDTLRSRIRRKGWYRERTQIEKDVLESFRKARMEDEQVMMKKFREVLDNCLLQLYRDLAEGIHHDETRKECIDLMLKLLEYQNRCNSCINSQIELTSGSRIMVSLPGCRGR